MEPVELPSRSNTIWLNYLLGISFLLFIEKKDLNLTFITLIICDQSIDFLALVYDYNNFFIFKYNEKLAF